MKKKPISFVQRRAWATDVWKTYNWVAECINLRSTVAHIIYNAAHTNISDIGITIHQLNTYNHRSYTRVSKHKITRPTSVNFNTLVRKNYYIVRQQLLDTLAFMSLLI